MRTIRGVKKIKVDTWMHTYQVETEIVIGIKLYRNTNNQTKTPTLNIKMKFPTCYEVKAKRKIHKENEILYFFFISVFAIVCSTQFRSTHTDNALFESTFVSETNIYVNHIYFVFMRTKTRITRKNGKRKWYVQTWLFFFLAFCLTLTAIAPFHSHY